MGRLSALDCPLRPRQKHLCVLRSHEVISRDSDSLRECLLGYNAWHDHQLCDDEANVLRDVWSLEFSGLVPATPAERCD